MAPETLRRFLVGILLLLVLVPQADAQRSRGNRRRPPPAARAKGGTKPAPLPFSPYVLGPSKTPPRTPAATPPKPGSKGPQRPPPAEADLVTGALDLTRLTEEAQRVALHDHFVVCDLDGNSWLSLREAEITLALSREEYQRLDADSDGRLLEAELEPSRAEILARLGAIAPPREAGEVASGEPEAPEAPDPTEVEPPRHTSELRRLYPSPAQLLGRYDADRSGGLSSPEVQALFSEIALALSPELVVSQMDHDDSGQLQPLELVPLCVLVSRHLPDALRPRVQEPELEPSELQVDATPEAPALPVLRSHFARLDPSGDGAIDDTDLRALQSPARLGVRVEAVLAALDVDGDGRLSEAEFRQAMGLR